MIKKLIWNGIKFDDFEEEPSNYWSQVCEDCIKKYNIPKKYLDTVGCGICGVEGKLADFYNRCKQGYKILICTYFLFDKSEQRRYNIKRQ